MVYIYVVFSSRNQAMIFYNKITQYCNKACIVNTPKQLGTSCSISVVISEKYFSLAQNIIKKERLTAFKSFYVEKIFNNCKRFVEYN